MAEGYEPAPPSGWREFTLTFPAGATETQYSKAFVNDAIGLVYISLYVMFPSGLTSNGIIVSGLPNSKCNVEFTSATEYDGASGYTYRAIYYRSNSLKIRNNLSAGYGLIGTIIYPC